MKNNKGFSLVELIVVIAIMAILVGLMAPQLIKFMEKSKVASDQSLLDGLEVAITYAVFDPVVNEDPASMPVITELLGVMKLEDLEAATRKNTVLYEEIVNTLGWPDLSHATYESYIKSFHDPANCEIYISYRGDFTNPIIIWITTTDETGNRDTSNVSTDPDNIGGCIKLE